MAWSRFDCVLTPMRAITALALSLALTAPAVGAPLHVALTPYGSLHEERP